MSFDGISGRIGKLFFFVSTLFIISISLAGIIYTDSFATALGFDFSFFDLNVYTFFTQVLISDEYHVLGKGIVALLFIIPFIYVYPNSLLLVVDLLCLMGLYFFKIVSKSFFVFLCLMISPFILLIVLTIFLLLLLSSPVILPIIFILKKMKMGQCIKDKCKHINLELDNNQLYNKISNRIHHNESSYLKAAAFYCLTAVLLIVWLHWIVEIGSQGEDHANIYLNSQENKSIQLTNNSNLNGVLIAKVKGGYLFVLNNNNSCSAKASFISDSAILRID